MKRTRTQHRTKSRRGEQGRPVGVGRGGARAGAGRPPKDGIRAGVSHLRRAKHEARHPLLVTLRLKDGLPTVKSRKLESTLEDVFRLASEKPGFRVLHHGTTRGHVHLIVEAADRDRMARGMQGLSIRLAKALNRVWERAGSVFADRYDARPLETQRALRDAKASLHDARK